MKAAFKTPGILRAAFYYQDLIGIDVLLRVFRDPTRYAWVKLEAADDPSFRAIDDVVVCRNDGQYELLQVKFTPNPSAPGAELNWRWLLDRGKGPKATSLLQKWSKTTNFHNAAGSLGSATLRTDRRPDAEFLACLKGQRVDYGRVHSAVRTQIEAQIGSHAEAVSFFSRFEFSHSEEQLADLEQQLKSRIVPSDTDDAGWSKLTNAVWNWSTLKDHPRVGGQITFADLTQIITRQAPKPIPQDFHVPDGYDVPNAAFHKAFIASVSAQDGITVLWGSPGRGKSTYLSYCAEKLRSKKEVWVRHHYFLSLSDTSTDRFYYHEIAHSLMAQIRAAVPEAGVNEAGQLRDTITQAAAYLANDEGRLVIVIDGLDHVWRERRSLEHMAHLFNALLPLPDSVSLVIGTQKVPDEQLPARLLSALPKDEWTELPLMSVSAVKRWLHRQRLAGRLEVEHAPHVDEETQFDAVVAAFQAISRGLPLHLIYSFEALVRRGGPISVDDVLALPPCPDGDIRTYYQALWTRVEARAREVLHVLAGVQFPVPTAGLWEIFGRSAQEAIAIEQIDHLLERRQTGVLPFHGSIFAFVRDKSDHQTVLDAFSARIVAWLANEAPAYWRWAWLWITKAQFGAPDELLNGPNRPWAISAMANGYGLDQIKLILEQAETLAFDIRDLSRTVELRSLYTRIANAPEFQTQDISTFVELAVGLSTDEYPRLRLLDGLTSLSPKLMLVALRTLSGADRNAAVGSVLDELNLRIERQLREERLGSSTKDLRSELLCAAALADNLRIKRVVRYARQFENADALMADYARECLRANSPEAVVAAGKLFRGREFARELTAALAFEGISPTAAGLPPSCGQWPLIRSWSLLKEAPLGSSPKRVDLRRILGPAERYETYHPATRAAIHDLFFTAFAAALDKPSVRLKILWPDEIEGKWLQVLFQDVDGVAAAMAEAWTAHSIPPSLAAFYAGLSVPRPYSRDYGQSQEMIAARLGLNDLAFDLQVLARGLNPAEQIDASDLASATDSSWWHDEVWLENCSRRRLPIHSIDGAAAFAQRQIQHLNTTVMDFLERAELATKVAQFARDNGDEVVARAEVVRAADCLIGYGWRKDLFALEVLHSMEHLIAVRHSAVDAMIVEAAPAYDAITDYTDGDETDHVRSEYYALLARRFPERGLSCYRSLLEQEEWRYADELLRETAPELPDDAGRTALFRTFIETDEFNTVSELAQNGRDAGTLSYLNLINGQAATTQRLARKDRADSNSRRPKRSRPIDVSKFPATTLEALLNRIRKRHEFGEEAKTLIAWMDYWEAQGQGGVVLETLAAYVATEPMLSLFDRTLDAAFKLSLRVQGRSKAFDWAVIAHRHRYGWQRWYTSHADTVERLDLVAKEFPSRWWDFILATAEPVGKGPSERRSRVLGLDRLVYFLVKVGQIELAVTYTRAMVRVLLEEVSNQPLQVPKWAA